jgi:predicted HicB family RNase H-like nuclease
MQPLPAATGRNKTVAIDEELHARLKVIAAQEGKMLQALVESILETTVQAREEARA